MNEERNHIKIFVSSTVYDFETDLRRIFLTLDGFGYDVYMSKEGTIPLDSRLSNLINCVNGVEECDIFLGIVRPLIGSGVLEKRREINYSSRVRQSDRTRNTKVYFSRLPHRICTQVLKTYEYEHRFNSFK